MTTIEQIAHLGNREYRVESFETVDTRVLRWQVVSQPINKKTGKGWQAIKRHTTFLKTSSEAFTEFNKLVGWDQDPDASRADAAILRRLHA